MVHATVLPQAEYVDVCGPRCKAYTSRVIGYVGYLGLRRVPLSDFARRIFYTTSCTTLEVEKKGRESCRFHSPARTDSSAALVGSRRSAMPIVPNIELVLGWIFSPHNLIEHASAKFAIWLHATPFLELPKLLFACHLVSIALALANLRSSIAGARDTRVLARAFKFQVL